MWSEPDSHTLTFCFGLFNCTYSNPLQMNKHLISSTVIFISPSLIPHYRRDTQVQTEIEQWKQNLWCIWTLTSFTSMTTIQRHINSLVCVLLWDICSASLICKKWHLHRYNHNPTLTPSILQGLITVPHSDPNSIYTSVPHLFMPYNNYRILLQLLTYFKSNEGHAFWSLSH